MCDPVIKKFIIISALACLAWANQEESSPSITTDQTTSISNVDDNDNNQTEPTTPTFTDSNGRSLFEDIPRQGRIINDEKISIKGFIPIVGLSSNDDDKKDGKQHQSQQYSSSTSERNYQNQMNHNNNNDDNPNSYDDAQQGGQQQHYPQHQAGPEDQRFIGAALQGLIGNVGSLTRPYTQQMKHHFQQQQQQINRKSDCVCVPFYMCRNGFIVGSASGGGGGGFNNNNHNLDPYGSLMYGQQRKQQQQEQTEQPPTDSYYPINERSLDDSSANLNNTKFAEEILGRMMGRQAVSDRCGLLRTCCQRSNQNAMISNDLINDYIQPDLGYGQPTSMFRPHHHQQSIPSMIEHNYHHQLPQAAAYPQQPSMISGYPTTTSHHHHQHALSPGYRPGPTMPQQQYRPPKLVNAPSQLVPSFDGINMPIPIRHDHLASIQRPIHSQQHPAYMNCGARQSIGINGRVQNLNYHQSSTEFAEFPWQVAILKRIGPSDNLYVCGGALISSNFVLTAAHCIKKFQSSDLKIRLGEWDVHREDEFYPYVEKNVDEVFVHPNFVPRNLMNDVALLRLDSELDLSQHPHISPICMSQPMDSFAGQRCYVAGWGKNAFGQQGEYQSVLMKVDLPVVDSRTCENLLKQTKLGYQFRLDRSVICAGGEHGKDACEGDGGSGLVCEQNGVWKVAGLVSWGLGCGQAGVPGVYTNIGHVRSWIDKVVLPYHSMMQQQHRPPIQTYPNFNELINERSLGNDTISDSSNQTTTINNGSKSSS